MEFSASVNNVYVSAAEPVSPRSPPIRALSICFRGALNDEMWTHFGLVLGEGSANVVVKEGQVQGHHPFRAPMMKTLPELFAGSSGQIPIDMDRQPQRQPLCRWTLPS